MIFSTLFCLKGCEYMKINTWSSSKDRQEVQKLENAKVTESWFHPSDKTKIDGGNVYAGTVTSDKLTIGMNPNLLVAGLDSFEQLPDGVPAWSIGSQSMVTIVSDVGYDGSKSIKFQGKSDTDSSNSYFYIGSLSNTKHTAEEGKQYFISFYAKTNSSIDLPMSVVSVPRNGSTALTGNSGSFTISANSGWKRYAIKTTAMPTGQNLTHLSFYVRITKAMAASEYVWFDAFQLEEVPASVIEPSPWKPAGTTVIHGGNITAGSISLPAANYGGVGINSSGITIDNSKNTITVNSTDGIKIVKKLGNKTVFSVDTNGDVIVDGNVTIGSSSMFEPGYDPTKIQVGGRNLLLNTAFKDVTAFNKWSTNGSPLPTKSIITDVNVSGVSIAKITTDINGAGIYQYPSVNGGILTLGKEYTISYYAKSSVAGKKLQSNLEGYTGNAKSETLTTSYAKYTNTIKGSGARNAFTFYSNDSTLADIYIHSIKVEEGNKATDWTPAPEDIDVRLTTAESSISSNANEISTKVTQTQVDNSINDINTMTKLNGTELLNQSYVSNVGAAPFTLNGGSTSIVPTSELSLTDGRNMIKTVGSTWLRSEFIPYVLGNPVYMKLSAYNKDTTSGTLYVGLEFYDKDKVSLGSNDLAIYAVTANTTALPVNSWTSFEGYVTPPTTDPNRNKASFIKIRILTRWSGSTTDLTYLKDISVKQLGSHNSAVLGTRLTTAESSITQNANNISLKVSKDGVISSINQSAEVITIDANKININGAVTFSSFDSNTKNIVSSSDGSLINTNPSFVDWTGAYPTGYVADTGSAPTKVTSDNNTGNALKYVVSAGTNIYTNATYDNKPFQQYIYAETTFKLESGSIDGAGILLRYLKADGTTTLYDNKLSLKSLISSPILNKWYTVSKVFKMNVSSDFSKYRVFVMGGWSGFEAVTAKTIYFDSMRIRPATEQEIKAYESDATINGNKATWDKATNINADGTFNTSKLNGTVSDSQIASSGSWNSAKSSVDNMSNDNKLTPSEKQAVKRELDQIVKEKVQGDSIATSYGITTEKTNYGNAYTTLYNYVNPLLADLTITSDINGATMRSYFADYYDKASILANAINSKAKTLADGAQTTANTANSKIDNLKIGGGNLVPNSGSFKDTSYWGSYTTITGIQLVSDSTYGNLLKATGSASNSRLISNFNIPYTEKKDRTLTVTMVYKTSSDISIVSTGGKYFNATTEYNSFVDANRVYTDLGNGFTKLVSKIDLTYATDTQYIKFYITTGAQDFYLARVKVEDGNTSTEWTPSQKDVDDWVSTVESTANTAVDDMSNDNKLTAIEKTQLKKEWDIIISEKPIMDALATTYSITTEKTNYGNSYNTLSTYITPLLADLTVTSNIVGTTMRANVDDYYEKKMTLQKAINEKAKSLADGAQSTANTANSTANTANSKIDNLQIGGRNVIQNSTFNSSDSNGVLLNWVAVNAKWVVKNPESDKPNSKILSASATGNTANQIYSAHSNYFKATAGDTFTFTIDLKVTDFTAWDVKAPFIIELMDATGTRVQYKDVYNTSLGLTSMNNGQWYRASYTVTVGDSSTLNISSSNAVTQGRIRLSLFKNGEIFIREVKVENGNRATTWTLAPEDVDKAIGDVKTTADQVKSDVSDMSNDNKLTPVEKHQLKKEWDVIVAEKPTVDALATTYGITTEKTNYGTSYNTLNTYVTPLLSDLTTTSDITGATMRANFDDYYDKKMVLTKVINEKSRQMALDAETNAKAYSNVLSSNNSSIINSNYNFADWTGTLPTGYIAGTGTNPVKVTGSTTNSNALKYVVASATNSGNNYIYQDVSTRPWTQYMYIEMTFKLETGTIDGAGVLVYVYRADNTTIGQSVTVSLKNEVPSPVLNKWHTVSKVIKLTSLADFGKYRIHPMGGWTGFSAVTDKTIHIDSLNVRPATAEEAKSYDAQIAISDMTSDDKISPVEKGQLKKEWATIVAEKANYVNLATTFGVSSTNYTNAYNTIDSLLNNTTNGYLLNTTVTTDLGAGGGATFRGKFDDYYAEKSALINAINSKARQMALDAETNSKAYADVQASIDSTLLNKNFNFSDWTGTYPNGYSSWAGSAPTKVASDNNGGNSVKMVTTVGANSGMQVRIPNKPYCQYVYVESTFKLESGSLSGSGVLFRYWKDSGTSNVLNDCYFNFSNKVASPILNKWYTVGQVFKVTNTTPFYDYHVYVMGSWNSFDATMPAKTIYFDSVKVRPATEQEINAYESEITLSNLASDSLITQIERKSIKDKVADIIGFTPFDNNVATANFVGKVTASTTVNPHIYKGSRTTTMTTPTASQEAGQSYIDNIKTLDGINSNAWSSSILGEIPQHVFSFNLIEHIKRTYGYTPSVQWLKDNISNLTGNWHGYGNSIGGNKASFSVWQIGSSTYATPLTNTASTPSKLSFGFSAVSDKIDSNGFVHFIAYTDAVGTVANPTTAPTLSQSANAGSTLAAGTYYVTYTWVTANGETLVSPEASLAVTSGNNLVVTVPAKPANVTSVNVYIGTATGTGTKQGNTTGTTYTQSVALVSGTAKPTSTSATVTSNIYTDYVELVVTLNKIPTATGLDNNGVGSFYDTRKQALNAGLTTSDTNYTNLETQYTNLKSYLEGLTPVTPWNTTDTRDIAIVPATWNDKWLQYYEAGKDLAQATASKLKSNADNAQSTANSVNTTVSNNQSTWGRASNINSDGTFNTSKLYGTVSDAQVASSGTWNTTTDKVSLNTDAMNYNPNPSFEGGKNTFYTAVTVFLSSDASVPTGAPKNWVGRQSGRDNYISDFFTVKAGDKFVVEGWVASTDSTQNFGLGLNSQDNTGTSSWYVIGHLSKGTGAWQYFKQTYTIVANHTKARFFSQINASSSFGNWFFTDVRVTKVLTDDAIASATNWNTAKANIDDMSSDMKVTPSEKVQLSRDWEAIKAEYVQISAQAASLSVSSTNYTNAYNALDGTTPKVAADVLGSMSTTYTFASTTDRDNFKTKFTTYFTEAEKLKKASIDATREVAQAMATSKMIYTDPIFKNGMNGVATYNNAGGGTVAVTRVANLSDSPTTSSSCLQIQTTGTASPGNGGFYFGTMSRPNAVFITRIIAKIPVGSTINFASNSTGTGGSSKWLTSNTGTGDWEEYIFKLTCGSSGTFSTTNYFYLTGGTLPLTWNVAYATVFDITDNDYTVIDNQATWSRASNINADGTINSSKLYGSIVDSQIASATSWNGAKSLVDSWKSGTTLINGGMIATNTIFAQQIAIGDFTNLSQINEEKNPNGNATAVVNTKKYFKIGQGSYANLNLMDNTYVEFKVNDEYYIAYNGYRDSTVTTVTAIMRYYYSDSTYINAGSIAMTPTTADTRISANLKITAAVDEAKTLTAVKLFFEKDSGATGYYYVRDIEIRKRYTGELIVDGTLTAAKLQAGTLTITSLDNATQTKISNGDSANSTVNNWKMSGKTTINGGNIETDTIKSLQIDVDNLWADAAFVTNFQTQNLNATKITSGTLDVNRINAGTITVDKLATGVTPNLIKRGYDSFEQFANGDVVGGGQAGTVTVRAIDSTYSYDGDKALKLQGSGTDNYLYLGSSSTDYHIPVTAGKSYILSFYAYNPSATAVSVEAYLKTNDTAATHLGTGAVNIISSNGWYRVEKKVTAPTGATKGLIRIDTNTANLPVWFDCLMLEEANSSTTQAAAWKPASITTIHGGNITTGTLSADKITTGKLTASNGGFKINLDSSSIDFWMYDGSKIVSSMSQAHAADGADITYWVNEAQGNPNAKIALGKRNADNSVTNSIMVEGQYGDVYTYAPTMYLNSTLQIRGTTVFNQPIQFTGAGRFDTDISGKSWSIANNGSYPMFKPNASGNGALGTQAQTWQEVWSNWINYSALNNYSSREIKNSIKKFDVDKAISLLKDIDIYNFYYNTDDNNNIYNQMTGMIFEEAEEHELGDLIVNKENKGIKMQSVTYMNWAINKELLRRVEELTEEVSALKIKNK